MNMTGTVNSTTKTQFAEFAKELAKVVYKPEMIVQLPLLSYYNFRLKVRDYVVDLIIADMNIRGSGAHEFDLYLELELIYVKDRKSLTAKIELNVKSMIETLGIVRFKVRLEKPKKLPLEAIYPVVNVFKKIRLVPPPPEPYTPTIEL